MPQKLPTLEKGPKQFNLHILNLVKSGLLRGGEVSSLLVHALSLLTRTLVFSLRFLLSYFLSFCLSSIFPLFSISLFFLCFLMFLLVVVYCTQLKPFYTTCHDKIYRFTPQLLLACCGCPSRTTHQSTSCLATTTTLYWLRHVPFPDKRSFVLFSCFLWHSHPDKGWVFSLTNSYSMHLVILAHLCLFWVACHPSRTFFPKKLEREPQNRLPPSPHRQTIPSLTSDPWPTTFVLAGYRLVMPESCACSTPI